MPTFNEPMRPYEVLFSEANGSLSREGITVASGAGILAAGTVVAKITATGKYVAYDNAGTDGSETAAGVLLQGVDATSADAEVVAAVRLCEVRLDAMQWAAGLLQADIDAALVDLAVNFIVAR